MADQSEEGARRDIEIDVFENPELVGVSRPADAQDRLLERTRTVPLKAEALGDAGDSDCAHGHGSSLIDMLCLRKKTQPTTKVVSDQASAAKKRFQSGTCKK